MFLQQDSAIRERWRFAYLFVRIKHVPEQRAGAVVVLLKVR